MNEIESLLNEVRAADAAGDTQTAKSKWAEYKAAQNRQSNSDIADNVGTGARLALGQGTLLGFGDEIEAGLRTGFGLTGDYTKKRDEIRQDIEDFRNENPKTALGLELGGGFLTGGVGGGRVAALKGAKALSKGLKSTVGNANPLKRYASQGAVEGAITGAGEAEEMGDIPMSAGIGAALGGGAGAALPIGARLIGAGGGIPTKVPQRTGYEAKRMMDETGLTPQEIERRMVEGGPETMPADVDPSLRQRLETVYESPGNVKGEVEETLTNREFRQPERIENALDEIYPGERAGRSYGELRDDLEQRRSQIANQVYSNVYEMDVDITPTLDRFLRRPTGESVAKEAVTAIRDEFPDRLIDLEAPDTLRGMDFWDITKRRLDARIDKAVANEDNDKARRLMGMKEELVDELDGLTTVRNEAADFNPDGGVPMDLPERSVYRDAREEFARRTRPISAGDVGEKFMRMNSREVDEFVEGMAPNERMIYSASVAQQIMDKVGKSPETANIAWNVIKSADSKQKLRSIFPTEEAYERFMNVMKSEIEKSKTYKEVLTGSPTAKRIASRENMETPDVFGLAGLATQGDIAGLFRGVAPLFSKSGGLLPAESASQLGGLLTGTNPAATQQAWDKAIQYRPPGVDVMGGLLSGGITSFLGPDYLGGE